MKGKMLTTDNGNRITKNYPLSIVNYPFTKWKDPSGLATQDEKQEKVLAAETCSFKIIS